MDELEFNADAVSNADANLETEGYEAEVEAIKQAYPEEDWRTPEEQTAEKEAQLETTQPQEQKSLGQTIEDKKDEAYTKYSEKIASKWKPKYEADPITGLYDVDRIAAENNLAPDFVEQYFGNGEAMTEEDVALWEKHKQLGGQKNVGATWDLVNTIRNDERLTAVNDRNGDGEFTFSDFYDVSFFKKIGLEITPDRDRQLTDMWLESLENKTLFSRLPQFLDIIGSTFDPIARFQTMSPMGGTSQLSRFLMNPQAAYRHQRRKSILTEFDENPFTVEGGFEQSRQSIAAGLNTTADAFFSAGEKTLASIIDNPKEKKWDDIRTWFSGEAYMEADSKISNFLLRKDDPSSYMYGILNPVNKTWSDPLLFEVGRYAPVIAGGAAFGVGGGITAGGYGLSAKGATVYGLTAAKSTAEVIAVEAIGTNLFVDSQSNAMRVMRDEPVLGRVINAHPETLVGTLQSVNGQDNAWTRHMDFMKGEIVTEGAFHAGLNAVAFPLVGKALSKIPPKLPQKLWQRIQVSTNAKMKEPINQIDNFWKQRKQVLNDKFDAALDQKKIVEEGPASKWKDPWETDGELDSTFGDYKNIQSVAGQGSVGIRDDIYDVVDQFDEIRGQVGIEGGITSDVFTPIERAEFSKSGIPDPWNKQAADAYWNKVNTTQRLQALNPLDRNLKNLSNSSLASIQEILGRDSASLSPEDFWPKEFLEMKFKPGEKLSDTKKWVIENLQVKDAVVNSLMTRLRAYADATGEVLGKGDIFAKGGGMSNIAKNLAMGLTEIKKTQFKWNLATKKMLESNGELTPKMIKEIDELVYAEQLRFGEETRDGVRLLMQVLKDSDSDELAEGILDVFKVSNDIHNWKDFDNWMRSKIRGGEFAGEINNGALLSELRGVMVNSILSGPKTPLRALLGTTTNSFLNAINEAAGATLRSPFTGDLASQTASVSKLKGMFELIPESFTVFRKNFKAKWNADIADIRTRYSEGPTRSDQNWNLFSQWTERNGTKADKAAFYMANIARNLNNNKLLTWSPRAMSAIDDTFKWLMARTRAKEKGFREALETAGGDYSKLTPDILKNAEDNYYKNFLNKEGDIDFGADNWLKKQYEEVTLTSELKGWAKDLDKVFKKQPLIQPFYLFARTGINGLNFTYKNTPLLGALHKESIDILRHTGDDFTALRKYGIDNANDLANARNLFAGRQAVGAATVTTFAGMYMAGQLTGNGPADRSLKQNWINSGWKPNHFYVGDVGFDYSGLEPYNTIFSAIADIGDNMELMGSEWAEKRLQAVAFVIGRGLTSKTYMSGLDQMMQMAQFKPGAWEKGAANIMNNSIPLAGMRNEFGKWVNPHMKELNSDLWSSIRNRNQFLEPLAGEKLPEKSDILNGKPIRNWNIIGRSFNAISPIQMDVRNDTPGRRLLLDSNYDLKSTTYAFGGYSFTKNAHVRAHFQNAIGTVPITVGYKKFKNVEEALNYLATRQDVKNSMAEMKANVNNPSAYDINPNTYPHNTLIDNIMNQAREKAWAKLNQPDHPGYTAVQELKAEKDGHSTRTRENRNEILELSFPRKETPRFPK